MSEDHVRLRVGREHYAAPVGGVREISPLVDITAVPGAAAGVLGVWNLRGDVVAAIDLAVMLGVASGPAGRIVVVEGGDLHAGLVVEEVVDVGPLPGRVDPVEHPHLTGSVLADDTPVGLLDLESVLEAARAGSSR
jgi:chemotaxis signal transduction protein